MQTSKIELEKGYSLEVVRTLPNNEGHDLEAYLYDGDMLVDELISITRYKTIEDAVVDYKLNLLPDYKLRKTSGRLVELTNDKIESIAIKYITKRKIKYGMIIDGRDVFTKAGYLEPDLSLPNVYYHHIAYYDGLVKKLTLVLVKELKIRGFYPDRVNSDRTYTFDTDKVKVRDSMNLVYTRYPWYESLKMAKLVNSFKVASDTNFVDEGKLKDLKQSYNEVYVSIKDTNESLRELNIEFRKIANKIFQKKSDKLSGNIAKNINEMVKHYRKICPYR